MCGSIDVLIVEDDRALGEQLKWLLRGEHDVQVATSRRDAMDILRGGKIHVAIVDLGLPPYPESPTDGLALIREALQADKFLKVIVMTAHGDQATAREAMALGAYDFLVKPVEEGLLLTLIKRAYYRRELEVGFVESQRLDLPVPILVSSPAMEEVIKKARAVAPLPVSCIIYGETGTGKELVARLIHALSPRRNRPWVVVDCTSIPVSLGESELFGAEKGSYTGATERREGRIRQAEGGTLLLDEVGELSLELQSKLLRFLETKQYTPIGGRTVEADARVLAATNRVLPEEVKRGRFRPDLYHRLNQVAIRVPPLRERPAEILPLARHLLALLGHEFRMRVPALTPEAERALQRYDFPGNVRELKNILSRAMILSRGGPIGPEELGVVGPAGTSEGGTREWPLPVDPGFDLPRARAHLEETWVRSALARHAGKVAQAAAELGVPRSTLYDLMHRHRLKPEE
ncbi:MAG: sigma-54-dependent transcriptional regulator [Thermodesulfobacteriota bacterium]